MKIFENLNQEIKIDLGLYIVTVIGCIGVGMGIMRLLSL